MPPAQHVSRAPGCRRGSRDLDARWSGDDVCRDWRGSSEGGRPRLAWCHPWRKGRLRYLQEAEGSYFESHAAYSVSGDSHNDIFPLERNKNPNLP